MSTETMTQNTLAILAPASQETAPASQETAKPETQAERRHRMRIEATARHGKLRLATILERNADRDERKAEGVFGREGYVAWTFERMESIRHALHGSTVRLTLAKVHGTKKGQRVSVTGVALVTTLSGRTETIVLQGEATVMDAVTDVSGREVDVRLERAENRKGERLPTFKGESRGVDSSGQRTGLKVRLTASRFVRTVASAL